MKRQMCAGLLFLGLLLIVGCATPASNDQSNDDVNHAQQQLLDSVQSYQNWIVSNNRLKGVDVIYCLSFSAKKESIEVFLWVDRLLPYITDENSSSLRGMYLVNEMNVVVYDSIVPCAESYYASWTESSDSVGKYDSKYALEVIPISLPKYMSFELPREPALLEK
jgi:hypothetical protein